MIVTLQELAEVTGYTVQTLIRWQKSEGMPVELAGQRGKGNQYDTAKVIAWLIARELAKAQAETPKDRLDRLRGDREELALARELDEVGLVADFERAWADHVLAARTELLALPEVLASEISAEHGIAMDPDVIQGHIEAALSKLEKFDVDDDDPDEFPDASGDASSGEEDD